MKTKKVVLCLVAASICGVARTDDKSPSESRSTSAENRIGGLDRSTTEDGRQAGLCGATAIQTVGYGIWQMVAVGDRDDDGEGALACFANVAVGSLKN